MPFYHPNQLVAAARAAPFYADLYANLPISGYAWHEVPIATVERINATIYGDCQALMTCPSTHGMFYLSSGTTNAAGLPKTSFFSRDEWREYMNLISALQWKNGLIRAHDTVLNITPGGQASNLLVHEVVQHFPVPCSEVPLGADAGYPRIIAACRQFRAGVVAGLNSTLVGLADALLRSGQVAPTVERLLGGGELLYGAQLDMLHAAFPNAIFAPFNYGTTDAGLIGYCDLSSGGNSYRAVEDACLFEIVDPATHDVVRDPDRVGMVVTTSLLRLAMPVVRYAAGDMAAWLDDPAGPSPRFALRGRLTPDAFDFEGVAIKEANVVALIGALAPELRLSRLQVVLAGPPRERRVEVWVSLFRQERSESEVDRVVRDCAAEVVPGLAGRMSSVQVRAVDFSHFEESSRRKGRLLVDQRS